MSDDLPDDLIDAELRNVAVPVDLAARLKDLAQWNDAEIDRDLTGIPVPSSLVARLKDITADAPLDEALQKVELPEGLHARLHAVPTSRQVRRSWEKVGLGAIAAITVLAISLSYSDFALKLLFSARPQPAAPDSLVQVPPLPAESEAEHSIHEVVLEAIAEPAEAFAEAATLVADYEPVAPWEMEDLSSRPAMPVEEVLLAARDQRLQLVLQALRVRPLGAPLRTTDESPQLDLVGLPVARGIATPLIPGYDRAFLRRTGFHPPVVPRTNVNLERSLAPLSVATDSFDHAVKLAKQKRRLAAEEVRTEDFLAAMDYQFAAPAPGQLGLNVMTGPSRFGPDAGRILALGVKAGEAPRRVDKSTHLVLAIDFSATLAQGGTWLWLQEALSETLQRLGPEDRMTLLFFQQEVMMRSQPLDRGSAVLLRDSLRNAQPRGGSDVAAGLDAAIEVALSAEVPAASRRIVLLSAGGSQLLPDTLDRLRVVSGELRKAGTKMDVVNLQANHVASGTRALASAIGGEERLAPTRRKLVHGLLDLLHGDQAIAASQVQLVVHFQPKAVAAYRLLGHEANAMAQLVSPGVETELHAGDESMVLFELLPTADKSDVVAEVELRWREGISGTQRSVKRRVSRSELAHSWESVDADFRTAVVAAETAEQWRGSRQALREFGWSPKSPVTTEALVAQARSLQSLGPPHSLAQLVTLLESVRQADEGRAKRTGR